MSDYDSNDNPDLIPARKMTRRQGWAVGYLAENFHEAGRFFEQSDNKTADAKIDLYEIGYTADEIEPIVKHFNATVSHIAKLPLVAQKQVLEALEKSRILGLRKPPAPPKSG